jgi:hypothetical protein
MTSILINTVAAIVRHLVGSDVWAMVTKAVSEQADESVSGEEKRAAVISAVQSFGVAAATWAVNLAIETAVAKLKLAQGEA